MAVFGQIADRLAGIDILHDSTQRYVDVEVITGPAGLVPAGTGLAVLRFELPRDAKIRQRIHRVIGNEIDAAAMPAVAAIRAAALDVLLAAEAKTAIATVAGHDPDCCFVDEFHCALSCTNKKPRERGVSGTVRVVTLSVQYADVLTVIRPFLLEFYLAVLLGKQRVITPDANVDTRVKTRAALTHDDVARRHFLAAKDFDAQAFGF